MLIIYNLRTLKCCNNMNIESLFSYENGESCGNCIRVYRYLHETETWHTLDQRKTHRILFIFFIFFAP